MHVGVGVVSVSWQPLSAVVLDGSVEVEGESTGGADKGKAHCPGSVEEVGPMPKWCVPCPSGVPHAQVVCPMPKWCGPIFMCARVLCRGCRLMELCFVSSSFVQTVEEEGR